LVQIYTIGINWYKLVILFPFYLPLLGVLVELFIICFCLLSNFHPQGHGEAKAKPGRQQKKKNHHNFVPQFWTIT